MIDRSLRGEILAAAKKMPVIAVLGPRQSGKTTLTQMVFKNHKYISLEDITHRTFANSDPKGFLEAHENDHGIILDEIQVVPELLSAIQVYVDRRDHPGYIVITGSQNFLINQAVSQTLAGRVAIFTLLPLTINELQKASLLPKTPEELMFNGSYPRIYDKKLLPKNWYPDYIRTYVERDIRDIKQVVDLSAFQRFIRLCAGRVGQLLNMSSLSNDCGISVNTVKSWISLLEATYILFLLRPYHKNFSKRIIKSPKLYFYDTGLVCSLLGIYSAKELKTNYLRGNIFESFAISELLKIFYNQRKIPNIYFWRDRTGNEIDCLIERAGKLTPIEIKSSKTISPDFFTGLKYFNDIANLDNNRSYLIYTGEENQKRTNGNVINWKSIEQITT